MAEAAKTMLQVSLLFNTFDFAFQKRDERLLMRMLLENLERFPIFCLATRNINLMTLIADVSSRKPLLTRGITPTARVASFFLKPESPAEARPSVTIAICDRVRWFSITNSTVDSTSAAPLVLLLTAVKPDDDAAAWWAGHQGHFMSTGNDGSVDLRRMMVLSEMS